MNQDKPARVAIVGSHNFSHPEWVQHYVNSLPSGTLVICGDEPGVQEIVICSAKARLDLPEPQIWGANFKEHGRRAGLMRNYHIVYSATKVVAFWDSKCKETKHAIELAIKQKKPLTEYIPKSKPYPMPVTA